MTQKKALLTEEGLKKLQDELKYLKTVRRREIAGIIQTAKEQGDLSENAEYVTAKEAQALLEVHIVEIEGTLKRAEVIKKSTGGDVVTVGSSVTIQQNGGQELEYGIVGANEADPAAGRISNESPLGASLLGKKVGEDVKIETPSGERIIRIVKVS